MDLTDDEGIRSVNREHLGRDGVTDVISFRLLPLPGEGEGGFGELVINVQQALEEGRRRTADGNWSTARELALYLAHGCDHLAGARDDDEMNRRSMRRRELNWIREAEREGLLDDLFR